MKTNVQISSYLVHSFKKKLGVSIADIFFKKIFNFSDTFRKAGFFGKQKNSQINNQFY